eukprot:UN26549
MREIQVTDLYDNVLLWISSNGEYDATHWTFAFEVTEKECPSDLKENECLKTYKSFRFDAQHFQYFVHILRHNYQDPGLKKGQLGYHLDIYPTPYNRFTNKKISTITADFF